MMSHLDIIILLVVVFVVFQKLKSLLGTRPEEEKRVHLSKESAEKLYDLLIKEAEEKGLRSHQAAEVAEPEELTPVDTEEMSELDKTLAEIPNFSKVRFVDSAQQAFQVITEAFNNADVETLEMLVSKDILKNFRKLLKSARAKTFPPKLTSFVLTKWKSPKRKSPPRELRASA